MEGTRLRLLQSLSPHEFRTGTEMGRALGLSRAAIHKHVQALVAQGVPIHRVPGRGYRLAEGVILLNVQAIEARLTGRAKSLISSIDLLEEVDSTSAHLARTPAAGGRVCLAEKQLSGRGRRGRSWVASPYRDLTMSIGVEYEHWPAHLPTLGLVTALAVVRALEELGLRGFGVKWPNDVVYEERKLCGVLLDVTGEAHGACRVIVGIGLNVSVDDEQACRIDQRWTDLQAVAGRALDRSILAAALLNALLPAFESFPTRGFAGYRSEWERLDVLRDRAVTVFSADGTTLDGTASGVDESGRLRVSDGSGRTRVLTQGDVSVRVR